MDRQSAGSETMLQQREQEILQQLTELLRGYGEKILSGQSKLSLTTRSLCLLNESFTSMLGEDELATSFDVLRPNSHKLHLAQDIQFLYDFMQKTLALKILPISSTLQGRVNLSPFKALRMLEIKKTPLHLLEGIQRMRGRLSTIICARSLSSLQELFEMCGGDLSTPMSWPELKMAGLGFNMIEKLDTSLRLVPRLEVLDLSHNCIKDTDRCLEYLTEVSIVNLGYNKISQVPTFAISARAKLSTLILRNNNLDNLNGVGELVGLRVLDVSDNCLCSHLTALLQLHALHRLGVLVLRGNPLSYHVDHRLLTIIQLNRTAANRVTLDGQAISQAELQAARKVMVSRPSKSRLLGSANTLGFPSGTSQSSLEVSLDTGLVSDPDMILGRPGRARHSGRATRRVRRAPISDLDSGCDAESEPPPITPDISKPSTPTATEHLDVKKHLETMRNQLGPDWLQTLVRSHTQPTNGPVGKVGGTSPITAPRPAGVTHPVPNGHCTIQSDLSSAGGTGPGPSGDSCRERLAQFAIGSLEDDEESKKVLAGNSVNRREVLQQPVCFNYQESEQNKGTAGTPDCLQGDHTDRLSDHIEPRNEQEETGVDVVDTSETNTLVKSAEFDTIYGRQQSQTDEVDYGAESEPFIVSLLSDVDTHHFVSVTHRYLLEKDINGDVIETLDLRCLQSANTIVLSTAASEERLELYASDAGDYDGQVIKLTFDHIRKDKRERLYLIEDEASVESLHELLQPVVDANQAELNLRDQMHCLKCSREFSKQQCSRTIRRHGSMTGTSEVHSTNVEQGDLTEVRLCPFCGSDMLIRVESEQRRHELVHTPASSFKEPNATSSTNPSPWKRTDSPINVPNKNQSIFGSLRSTQDAASFHSAMEPLAIPSPKADYIFLTPSSSQSDLTTFRTAGDPNDFSDQPLSLTPPEAATASTSRGRPVLKTVYMSQSSSEVSSHPSQSQYSDLNRNSVAENRCSTRVHRNHSSQDLCRSNYRKRQDSGSSDILVLSHQPPPHPVLSTFPSQDSDIMLISNPSQSSIAVIDSSVCSCETLDELESGTVPQRGSLEILHEGRHSTDAFCDSELSPAGSLTNKTLSSMVSTVYEKSIFDSQSTNNCPTNDDGEMSGDDTLDGVTVVTSSFKSTTSTPDATNNNPVMTHQHSKFSSPSTPVQVTGFGSNTNGNHGDQYDDMMLTPTNSVVVAEQVVNDDPGRVRFCYTDYAQIDHRLKLYLMMAICNHDDEGVLLINRCGLWHYVKGEEVPGLIVMSSHLIYFFKVTGPEKVDNPEQWLKLLQCHRIEDLCYVDIGLGYQTVRFEFGPDAGCLMLLIRDETRCKKFTRQFTEHMQNMAFSTQSKLEGITKNHPGTLDNMRKQVLEDVDPDFPEDEALVKFIMAYQHTGEITTSGEKCVRPVSMVVTSTYLHLVDEDLNWRALRGSAESQTRAPLSCQFTRKDRQKITNVTHLDMYRTAPLDVNLVFYDEESFEECAWRVALETRESLMSLVQSVKTLWDEQFGVDLLINHEEA